MLEELQSLDADDLALLEEWVADGPDPLVSVIAALTVTLIKHGTVSQTTAELLLDALQGEVDLADDYAEPRAFLSNGT